MTDKETIIEKNERKTVQKESGKQHSRNCKQIRKKMSRKK